MRAPPGAEVGLARWATGGDETGFFGRGCKGRVSIVTMCGVGQWFCSPTGLIEAMTSGERKLKEGKHQKEQRALAVARAQNVAYSVVAFDADHWDVIDAPSGVEKYAAFSRPAWDGSDC